MVLRLEPYHLITIKCNDSNTRSNTKRGTIPSNEIIRQKIKINTNLIHNRFHRSKGAIATIRSHDLWDDVQIVHGIYTLCTSCKIMTIPAHARGKERNSIIWKPLEEIQVDTVQNLEPNGISMESTFNYFLLLYDRYSRIFRIIGIRNKTSEACIDGIEQLISKFSTFSKSIKRI